MSNRMRSETCNKQWRISTEIKMLKRLR